MPLRGSTKEISEYRAGSGAGSPISSSAIGLGMRISTVISAVTLRAGYKRAELVTSARSSRTKRRARTTPRGVSASVDRPATTPRDTATGRQHQRWRSGLRSCTTSHSCSLPGAIREDRPRFSCICRAPASWFSNRQRRKHRNHVHQESMPNYQLNNYVYYELFTLADDMCG
jgi:hypothetical protein